MKNKCIHDKETTIRLETALIALALLVGFTVKSTDTAMAQEKDHKPDPVENTAKSTELSPPTLLGPPTNKCHELVGKPAPGFDLKTIDAEGNNGMASLEEFRGKVIVLEFWATWCPPCIAAIPHLNDLQEELGGDFVFISISSDKPSELARFLAQNKIATIVAYSDGVEILKKYGVGSVPTSIIIGTDGAIAGWIRPNLLTREQLLGVAKGKRFVSPVVASFEGNAAPAASPMATLQPSGEASNELPEQDKATAEELPCSSQHLTRGNSATSESM